MMVIYLFAAVAYAVSGHIIERQGWQLVILAILLAAWYVHGTCLNDLSDEHIDKVNLRHAASRPLANNKSSRRQLWITAATSALAAVLVAASQSFALTVLTLAMLALNWAYSLPPLRISYRGVVAPLLLPMGYVLFPFAAVMFLTNTHWATHTTTVLTALYAGFIGRIVLKDFRDVLGDRMYGKLTFIVRYGQAKTLLFSAFFWTASSIALAMLYWKDSPILSAVIFIHMLGVGYGLYLLQGPKPDSYRSQVIIGGLGRLASTSLMCLVIYGERGAALNSLPSYAPSILIVIVAAYGLAVCLDSFWHTDKQKVVF
jgi:4-hydroxybenzoate polyprenyltransferase